MDNPYEPSEPMEAANKDCCREPNIREWLLMFAFLLLSAIGAVELMHAAGIVVQYTDGSMHFWFEPQIKGWINETR